ncbi:MAG: glycosyltransferase family 4 protein, partial [Verrucomicrobiota bacterium]
MRLLFTNHQLTHYTGTELFVRELTTALKKRDHQVAVFSTRLGKVAEEIRAAGIPVVDDPADIPFTPDLIHGQHHFETLAALLAFPLCPALFHCHSSGRWQETPLIHPRIIRYAVITPRYMPWFKEEFNIPADKIDVVFNTVDLTRFQTVRTPSTTPEKALLFTSTISDGTVLDTLKAACKQCDLP